MSNSDEAIELLRSIDNSLKQMLKIRTANAPKPIASDRDLDGQYGDPVLKFMPRDWTGPSFKNAKYSQCPAALLDLVADSLEWFGKQADEKDERTTNGKPVGDYKRADAARARGWAKRIRENRVPATAGAGREPGDDDFGAEPGSEWQ